LQECATAEMQNRRPDLDLSSVTAKPHLRRAREDNQIGDLTPAVFRYLQSCRRCTGGGLLTAGAGGGTQWISYNGSCYGMEIVKI
ncbi:hypothetical protein NDU88_001016, partial [Pleurodeles waltl]